MVSQLSSYDSQSTSPDPIGRFISTRSRMAPPTQEEYDTLFKDMNSGCPKARTMEWIDRLEPCFRGPYTGSFGTIADDGDLHLNLIIRAMLIMDGHCYTQAGGGIVVDSTPDYEYKENQAKAQALLDLLK